MKKLLLIFCVALGFVFAISGMALGATLYVPTTYSTIQAAIDAAAEGDIIEVAAGTYSENITINKTISLLGAQSDIDPEWLTSRIGGEAIINGGQVEINAGGAILNGFKLEGNRIFINGASDVMASYNIIENSSMHGIRIDPDSPNATITYNTIVNPNWEGICNYVGNSGVIISYNHIKGVTDQHAIVSGMHTGTDIQITHNVISEVANAKGINYWGAPGAVINHNNISGTGWEAIFTDTTATIQGNKITTSSINGINLYPGADESVVNDNIISSCTGDGILVLATDVSVVKNTISCCKNGIWVEGYNNNKLIKNDISNIEDSGVGIWAVNNNKVVNNAIKSCNIGVFLGGTCDNNKIIRNVFDNNTTDIDNGATYPPGDPNLKEQANTYSN